MWILLTFIGLYMGLMFAPAIGPVFSINAMMVITFAGAPLVFLSDLLLSYAGVGAPMWLDMWVIALSWAMIFVVAAALVSDGLAGRKKTIAKTASYFSMFIAIAMTIIQAEQGLPV